MWKQKKKLEREKIEKEARQKLEPGSSYYTHPQFPEPQLRDTRTSLLGTRIKATLGFTLPSSNPTLTHCNNENQRRKKSFFFPKSKQQGQGFFRSQWRRNRRAPSPPAPPTNRCSIRSPRSFTATILPLLPLRIPIPKKPLLRPLRIGFFASSEGRDPFTPFSAPENVKLFFLFIIFALLFSLSFYCVLVFVTDSMWECCGCNYWIGKNIFWQEKNNKKKTRPCLAFAHVVYH